MPLALLKYQLPLKLGLPDGTAYLMNYQGSPTTVTVHTGLGVRKTIFKEVPKPDDGGKRIWYRAVHPVEGAKLPNRELRFNELGYPFVEEVIDHFGFSALDVAFEIPAVPNEGDTAAMASIYAAGLARLRHFIGIYAQVSPDIDVFLPAESDSPASELHVSEQYVQNDEGVEGTFQPRGRQIKWNSPLVAGLLKEPLDAAKTHQLIDALKAGPPVRLDVQLLLEARALVYRDQNPKLGLVVGETAFEVYLQFRLQLACDARGISQLPVGRGGGRSMKPVREALSAGSIREDLLGVHCAMLTKQGVKDSKQYQAWYDKAYEPRNAVVHGGRTDVSEPEALEALSAIVAFINFIDAQLAAAHDDGRAA